MESRTYCSTKDRAVDSAFNQALVQGLGYTPEPMRFVPPEGITLIEPPKHGCKSWLRMFTQGDPYVKVLTGGAGGFNVNKVINWYSISVGVSPYFTFEGYLYKFEYTGYDKKTGKFHHGGKYALDICTDGMSITHESGRTLVSHPSHKHVGTGLLHPYTSPLPSPPVKIAQPVLPIKAKAPPAVAPLPGPVTKHPMHSIPAPPGALPTWTGAVNPDGQQAPGPIVPVVVAPPVSSLAATAPMSTTAVIVLGLLAAGVLGGAAYLVLE